MNRLLPVVCLVIAGCLQPTSIEQPKGGDPKSPVPTGKVTAAEFGEALAQWTEQGNVKSSDEWYRLAQQGEKLGLKIDVEKPASREVLDDRLRKEYAAKARAIK